MLEFHNENVIKSMTLNEFLKIEKNLKLDDILIDNDIPLWRTCRRQVRIKYLNIIAKTSKPHLNFYLLVRQITKSFFQIGHQLISKKHVDYIFYPHARLYYINGEYVDKLTDPIIDLDKRIADSYVLLQYPQNGLQHTPRIHSENTNNLDFVVFYSKIWCKFNRKKNYKKYKKEIDELVTRLSECISDVKSYKTIVIDGLSSFLISYKISKRIISSFSPKKVLLAPRSAHSGAVVYCRRNNITVMELEHGITLQENELYSGVYNSLFDVDYFLTFGDASDNSCFGMPLDKIINIGFAYKEWLKSRVSANAAYDEYHILVLSEPHITDFIIKIVEELAQKFQCYSFYIRCHPQESLSKQHLDIVNKHQNVQINDNRQESFITFMSFQTILGENSTAIFEAISLGKKVGRLNFGGLKSIIFNQELYNGEFINSIDEFEKFLSSPKPSMDDIKSAYSKYNPDIIPNL